MSNVECPGCGGGMPFERAAEGLRCETCEHQEERDQQLEERTGRCVRCGQLLPEERERREREEAQRRHLENIADVRGLLEQINRPMHRGDDPPSSRIAAMSLLEDQPIIRHRLLVAALEQEAKGERYCSDHLGRALGMDPDQFSSQVSDLVSWGLLDRTGDMIETTRGNPCMELTMPEAVRRSLEG